MPKLTRVLVLGALSLLMAAPTQTAFAAGGRKHRTTKVSSSRTVKSKRTAAKKPIGPRGIDDQRATQIQAALIKAGYLTGEPSGHWDAASQAAMEKLQADNGWQTKLVPDSRALIKLGLGPASNGTAASQDTGSETSASTAVNSAAAPAGMEP